MNIERTTDAALIKRIVTHPAVWPHVSDDSTPREGYEPPIHDSCYWLAVIDGDVIGVYFLHPHNSVTYEIHTCLLPVAWGKPARKAARMVLDWMFSKTQCQKVITHVPQGNDKALHYAKRAGLVIEGVNRKSILKGGKLLDQTLLGITKEEHTCQQQ